MIDKKYEMPEWPGLLEKLGDDDDTLTRDELVMLASGLAEHCSLLIDENKVHEHVTMTLAKVLIMYRVKGLQDVQRLLEHLCKKHLHEQDDGNFSLVFIKPADSTGDALH